MKTKWNPTSHWDENPKYPVMDWQEEVSTDATRQGYHEWVQSQIEMEELEE